MKKRLALLSLLAALVAGAVYAGGAGETGAAASTAAPGDPLGKYTPPIEVWITGESASYITYKEGESAESNAWTKRYLDKFGIAVKYKWIVPGDQAQQKLNLAVASGDLPDFFVASGNLMKQLADADQIQDLTAVYKNYLSPRVSRILNEGGPNPLLSAQIGGKMMGIPWTSNAVESLATLFVRKDWRQKLGAKEPKSMDEANALAVAFTTKDPDGNGKDDTYGLSVDKDLWNSLTGYLAGYDAYRGIWIKDAAGKLIYGSAQPQVKAALAALADLYKKKAIKQDFSALPYDKIGEEWAQNRSGMLFAYQGAMLYPLNAAYTTLTSSEYDVLPLPSVKGTPAKYPLPFSVVGYWVARKGFRYPEAMLKMMDMWVELFYDNRDPEIEKQFITSPGWFYSYVRAYRATRNIDWGLTVKKALENPASVDWAKEMPVSKVVYDRVAKWKTEGRARSDATANAWEIHATITAPLMDQYIKNNLYVHDEFFANPTETMAKRWSTLQDLELETFVKIIANEQPVSAFDDFVKKWNELGGQQITDEVNAWRKTVK